MLRRATTGFTLLEMLVALALMAVLATALYMSLRISFNARKSAEAAIEPTRSAALALELLHRAVGGALPPTGILAGPMIGEDALTDDATGDADTLTFYGTGGNRDGAPVVRKIEFALAAEEDGSGLRLVERTTDNLLAPKTPDPAEEVLCRNVASLNFRYFDGASWVGTWDSTLEGDTLPTALEATLKVRLADSPDEEARYYELQRVLMLSAGGAGPPEGSVVVRSSGR